MQGLSQVHSVPAVVWRLPAVFCTKIHICRRMGIRPVCTGVAIGMHRECGAFNFVPALPNRSDKGAYLCRFTLPNIIILHDVVHQFRFCFVFDRTAVYHGLLSVAVEPAVQLQDVALAETAGE